MRDVCADSVPGFASSTAGRARPLLVNFPPTMAISGLVNSLKDASSRRPRQGFSDLHRHHWRGQMADVSAVNGGIGAEALAAPRETQMSLPGQRG